MTIFSRLALDGVLWVPFFSVVFPSQKSWCVNAILRLANFRLLGPSVALRSTCSPGIVADDSFTRHTSYILSNFI
ncbi:hypothetical protein BJ165DRAFT_1512153, partial [Panaeolus papilionaceus]